MVVTLDSYQLKLPAFEGPLDVLLRLIEREQLPVSEVSLIAVFDQFMAFTRELGSPAPEASAEFAAVAGRLSLLKSRALLPRPAKSVNDENAVDLVLQLEEYRLFKRAAATLAATMQRDEASFERGHGVVRPAPGQLRLMPQTPRVLTKAVGRWMARLPARSVPLPLPRVVSLREMAGRILASLDRNGRSSFGRICSSCTQRQEVAVAFLALLSLLRRRVVSVSQDELFGPIALTRVHCVLDQRSIL
jgi:segregation and condensation protein A